MLPKPSSCIGCPWAGDMTGFVPDEVPDGVRVLFVAQNPGASEELQGRPLIGVTGQMFRSRFVARHLPGVMVGYANILKCRAAVTKDGKTTRSNSMPPLGGKAWQTVVGHCRQYLEATLTKCPDAIVVPMGEHAALAVAGRKAKAMLHLRGTLV